MNARTDFILTAFNELKTRMSDHFPFDQPTLAQEENDFLEKLNLLLESIQKIEIDYSFQAQDVLAQFIRCYANLVPLIRRELLWFIGGECLHYLGDEEVVFFQVLEDRLYESEQEGHDINIDQHIQSLREELNPVTKH